MSEVHKVVSQTCSPLDVSVQQRRDSKSLLVTVSRSFSRSLDENTSVKTKLQCSQCGGITLLIQSEKLWYLQ